MASKWKVIFLTLLLLLPATLTLADELVLFKAGYQLLSPSGSIAGTINSVGQKVDIRDLNLADSENVTAEAALQWGNARFSFNYLPIEFSGTGTLSVAGSFNGQAFSINDRVTSEIALDLYDFGYSYYFINLDDLPTRFQLGLELAVKVVDAEVTFRDLTQNFVESESVTAPIPTIGLRTRIALADFLGLTGRIGYLEYNDNHLLDAEAQVEFSPLPTVGIYAGYRYFDLKIDEDDLYVETDFSGPFAGALVRF